MKSLKYIIAGFCLAALPGMEAMAQEVVKVDDPWKDYPGQKDFVQRLLTVEHRSEHRNAVLCRRFPFREQR